MKFKSANIILVLAILIGMASHAYAQSRRSSIDPKAWYIGAEGGGNVWFGDIKYWDYIPNVKYDEVTFGGGLTIGKSFSPIWNLKGNFHYSKLSGTKRTPGLLRTFKSIEQDASLSVQLNLFQLFNSRPRLEKLSVYGELGIGAIRWQSLLYNTRNNDTISNMFWKTKEYETALMIPLGLNIKYYINKNISMDLYSGLRVVNSDLLDAKEGGIKFDYYWYSGAAINYHIGFNNNRRKPTVVSSKRKSGELELLDYLSINPFEDPELERISKNELIKKEGEKNEEVEISSMPYLFEFFVPQEVNNKRFQILISIKKQGITGNGFFRLQLPSGFYPEPIEIKEVSYTRIAYNYDYDFYLPMNKDTLLIPINISVSERENGTYPMFVEGEIMNQNGELYSIKNAQYVRLTDSVAYNPVAKSTIREKKDDYIHPENVSEKVVRAIGDKTYRIQILACRKPSKRVDDFLRKHHINQKVYLYEAGGWWRYSIYNLPTIEQAEEYLRLVRTEHQLMEAFIVEFKNGARSVPKNQPARNYTHIPNNSYQKAKPQDLQKRNTTPSKPVYNEIDNSNNNIAKKENSKKEIITPKVKDFQEVIENKDISVYRIEIAVSPTYPIPLRQLQNWVDREMITEWTYDDTYRYTIGRFENEQVARAFLEYVRKQFALPDAHIVETKGTIWKRVVR